MDKISIIIIAVIVLLTVGIILLVILAPAPQIATTPSNSEPYQFAFNDHEKALGNYKEAPVVMVEFLDFTCPGCKTFGPIVKQAKQKYGDDMAVVYKHFVIKSHAGSQEAAEAAEAAANQGKYLEMHELLFANQSKLSSKDMTDYGEQLGLDMDTYNKALENRTHRDSLEEQRQLGLDAGVAATPSFYINGIKYEGVYQLDELSDLIDKALVEVQKDNSSASGDTKNSDA